MLYFIHVKLGLWHISELQYAQTESNYWFSFHSAGSTTIYRQIHGSKVSVSDRQGSTQAEQYEPVLDLLGSYFVVVPVQLLMDKLKDPRMAVTVGLGGNKEGI